MPSIPERPRYLSTPSAYSGTSIVGSHLSSSEIIGLLQERGCKNLTSVLNPRAVSRFPVSTGGFADVFYGTLLNGSTVAIKSLRPCDQDELSAGKYQKRAAKEIYAWSKCNHRNVARLMGLAKFRGRLAMISDWAENGSLPFYLSKYPSANRCWLSTSICDGLAYLHDNEIVHGDLKGANILVARDGTPMLTDFGNASLADSTVAFTATMAASFSLRWTAPEILKETSPISPAGDVYALGMTILETLTGEVPFSDAKDRTIYTAVVHKKRTPRRPEAVIPPQSICGNMLWTLLTSCWARKPQLRPSALQVRDFMSLLTPESLLHIEANSDSEDDDDDD